ncbi:zinc finger protein 271-like [Argiope bruennichi]|uniref:zinc finger protein 271-like n=1 Tax=Argiope bruennichi TaxID=94029 RepID=UPI002494FE17|nr:zinc finger protein 271-like [Argiope bruennichi]
MDNYRSKRCGNLVTRGEDHTCFRHKKFDCRYSLQRPVESDENHDVIKDKSTENSNEDQQRTSSNSSYFNPLSDVQGIEIQTNEIAYFTASSENVESSYRPVQSLKKDKKDFMDVIEYVIRNALSDINNNVSGTANSTEKPDLPPLDKEPKNCKMQVSESVNDEHISSEVHSQVHSNKTKVTTYVKEPHSTKKNDNAVAGPSGVRSCQKNFHKTFGTKYTTETRHRSHTDYMPFMCNICNKQFFLKSAFDVHYRIHTGEKPYVCDKCGKKFNQIGNFNVHCRSHTGEKPFVCNVCHKGFASKSYLMKHFRIHTEGKPYKCPVCGKTFMTSRDCNEHRSRMHE